MWMKSRRAPVSAMTSRMGAWLRVLIIRWAYVHDEALVKMNSPPSWGIVLYPMSAS